MGFRKYILLGVFICIFNDEIGIIFGKWVFYVLYSPLPIKALYKGFRPQNGPTLLHSMGNISATVIVTDSIFFCCDQKNISHEQEPCLISLCICLYTHLATLVIIKSEHDNHHRGMSTCIKLYSQYQAILYTIYCSNKYTVCCT